MERERLKNTVSVFGETTVTLRLLPYSCYSHIVAAVSLFVALTQSHFTEGFWTEKKEKELYQPSPSYVEDGPAPYTSSYSTFGILPPLLGTRSHISCSVKEISRDKPCQHIWSGRAEESSTKDEFSSHF